MRTDRRPNFLRSHHGLILAVAVAAFAGARPACAQTSLRLHLPQRVRTAEADIRIATLARPEGGNAATRRTVSSLDLETLTPESPFAIVTAQQIRMRCLLAGIPASQLQITGASSTLVELGTQPAPAPRPSVAAPQPSLEELALQAIRGELAARWQVPAEDIFLQLQKPLRVNLPKDVNRIRVRAYLPAHAEPGSMNVTTLIQAGDRTAIQSTAVVNALHRPADQTGRATLTDGRIRLVSGTTSPSPLARTTGLAAPDKPGPIVVRPRDQIRLVAQVGSLRVELTDAVALSQGRIGDTIHLRNPRSRKTIVARLISPSEAVVEPLKD